MIGKFKATSLILALCAFLTLGFTACDSSGDNIDLGQGDTTNTQQETENKEEMESEGETAGDNMQIKVIINGTTLTAELYDNTTAKAFRQLLPKTLNMSELNGNEKYHYLSKPLETNTERVGKVEAGDIMLFGSTCVVLFYESFSTSYSYSKIGKISGGDIKSLVGEDSVTVEYLIN